jgi:hypothetical protein
VLLSQRATVMVDGYENQLLHEVCQVIMDDQTQNKKEEGGGGR